MASRMSSRGVIFLLRNDLRLHDNEGFRIASQLITEGQDKLIPLFCFDPDHFQTLYHFGLSKTGHHRTRFLLESVGDLRSSLQGLGSDLVVRHMRPAEAIKDLVQQSDVVISAVVFQREVTKEELDVEKTILDLCQHRGIQVETFWGSTLYHLDDIPMTKQEVPDTYTTFRKIVESRCRIRPVIPSPKKLAPIPDKLITGNIPSFEDLELRVSEEDLQLDDRTAFPFHGGETNGLKRLESYLFETNLVATYKQTRNGLLGHQYSTKFSPWLANGSLSARQIYEGVKRYERERESNQSTYWVIFELIWRDYFRFICWKYGNKVFHARGIAGRDITWKNDPEAFRRWCYGQTGVPFVDANMRELLRTGWMSNRGRQNVASFLVKDLGIDWRKGAEWFETLLLDHDVCSNYGNWNYVAGIGNDPRENRKFNIVKQGLDYDPKGDFVRMWVPELSEVFPPGHPMIHFPWMDRMKPGDMTQSQSYPDPIVIAPEWRRYYKCPGKAKTTGQARGIDFYFKRK